MTNSGNLNYGEKLTYKQRVVGSFPIWTITTREALR